MNQPSNPLTGKSLASYKVPVLIGAVIIVFAFAWFGSGTSAPAPTAPVQPAPLPSPSFDVPSLLGKNIDQVRTALGAPQDSSKEPTALQIQVGADTWDNAWEQNGNALIVSFDPKSRKVTEFFVSPSITTSDSDRILAIGNLSRSDSRYRIKFVASRKGDGYTGVTVIPNP